MPEKEDRFKRLRNRTRDAYELAGEKIEKATESSRDVGEHPLTSVVVAAVIGAIVGVGMNEMIRRARQRDRKAFIKKVEKDVLVK